MVTVVIILSKMCGLLRDVITAGYFGTGIENDAYASAYSLFYIPVLVFNSCITATIVPLFVEEREKYSLSSSPGWVMVISSVSSPPCAWGRLQLMGAVLGMMAWLS